MRYRASLFAVTLIVLWSAQAFAQTTNQSPTAAAINPQALSATLDAAVSNQRGTVLVRGSTTWGADPNLNYNQTKTGTYSSLVPFSVLTASTAYNSNTNTMLEVVSTNSATNPNKTSIGFDDSHNIGYINCIQLGLAIRPCVISPQGANNGVGLTNPQYTWDVSGTLHSSGAATLGGALTLPALATGGTYTQAACLTSSGSLQGDTSGTICGLSAARFKNLIDDPINPKGLLMLRTESWRYKPQYQDQGKIEHVGLIADDVAKMDPRCVVRDRDGEISNYSDRCIEAYLVAMVKMQQQEIAELQAHH